MVRASIDRDTFLAHLRQSGLLPERELRVLRSRLSESQRGRAVARLLVERGLITKFQAELLLIGRTDGFFLGPYKILDQLGQGGMGRVYKALHQTMNRIVALKVLMPQVTKTPRAQQLFLREVQAAAQLNHPNIVTAYDAGQLEDRHYLAMEFVDGPNLEEYVRVKGPLPVGLACELIRQAACGLQHAFEKGMLHRDLKPANLLVAAGSIATPPQAPAAAAAVKILDFGLARLQEPSAVAPGAQTIVSRENAVMGTPDFIAPEQARDLHKTDIRSDLYSLGCTMYWLLTGKVPFPGGSTLEKLLRHNTEPPPPLIHVRGDVPEEVGAILGKLMAKNPAERLAAPHELMRALAPFAQPAALDWDPAQRGGSTQPATPASADEAPHGAAVDTLPQGAALTPLSTDSAELEARRFWSRRKLICAAGSAGALIATGVLTFVYWPF